MTESVNITAFIVFTVILYVILIIYTLFHCSKLCREYSYAFFSKSMKNELIFKITAFVNRSIVQVIQKILAAFVSLLNRISLICCKIEAFSAQMDRFVFEEPVDLTALVIRKFYGENEQYMIAAAAGLIVVFYFILTVF